MAIQQRRSDARESGEHGVQQWNSQAGRNGTDRRWPPPGSARPSSGERIAPKLGWFSIGLGVGPARGARRLSNLIGVRALGRFAHASADRRGPRGDGRRGHPGRPTPRRWLWARVAGDMMDLALLGRAFARSRRTASRVAVATASVVGITALDVYAAHPVGTALARGRRPRRPSMLTTKTVVVNRAARGGLRVLARLPRTSRASCTTSTTVRDSATGARTGRRRGRAVRPSSGTPRSTEDRPNELIAWRSLPGADVENEGSVRFERAPGGAARWSASTCATTRRAARWARRSPSCSDTEPGPAGLG